MTQRSVPQLIAVELTDLVEPLRRIATSDQPVDEVAGLLAASGWRLPVVDPTAFAVVQTGLAAAVDLVDQLASLDEPSDLLAMADALADVAVAVQRVAAVHDDLSSLFTSGSASLDADDLAELGHDIAQFLVHRWLMRRHPIVLNLLLATGVSRRVDVDQVTIGPDGPIVRAERTMLEIDLTNLGHVLSDPGTAVSSTLLPEGLTQTADAEDVRNVVRDLLSMLLRPLPFGVAGPDGASERHSDPAVARRLSVSGALAQSRTTRLDAALDIEVLSEQDVGQLGHPGPGAELTLGLDGTMSLPMAGWEVEVGGAATAAPLFVSADTLDLGSTPGLSAWFTATRSLESMVIGAADGTNLTIEELLLGARVEVGPTDDALDVVVDAAVRGARLVVRADDGFMAAIIPDDGVELEFDLGVTWSRLGGLRLYGGADMQVRLPINESILGVIDIGHVDLALSVSDTIDASVGIAFGANIGIVAISVDGLGLRAAIEPTTGGNLGAADLSLDIKWPTGLGIVIGTEDGPVSGGGFLNIDPVLGQYDAFIGIRIVKVGISAFVLIDTKALDGGGWSMFVALFIELPSIQLGFGFTLEGVGGVAGINRTVDAEALLAAARSGSIDGVLFPDPADAPYVIDAFKTFFPPAQDRYVFGPVIKIGWGAGKVTAQLGVVIELPDPILIAVLGSIGAVLPDDEARVVVIQMDVAGVIDFGAGTIAVDASLHGSEIAGFPLTGGMSLRASLKGEPGFLLAVGGFHPGFEPPAGFPDVPRVGMEIDIAGIVMISFQGYFAITSQTVQFGTALYLRAEISEFRIEGGFEFNALIYFNPFRLIADLDMFIAVTFAGIDLLAIQLAGQIEGPGPWAVTGFAEFRVLGTSHRVEVNETNGPSDPPAPMVAPGLLSLLTAELSSDAAWEVRDGESVGVRLAAAEDAPGDRRATPDSSIAVSQQVVPLKTDITKYGDNELIEHTRFDIVVDGDGLDEADSVTDWFSPGTFRNLGSDDSAHLAAPSFERMPAGLVFGTAFDSGTAGDVTIAHKVVRVDPELPLLEQPRPPDDVDLSTHPGLAAVGDLLVVDVVSSHPPLVNVEPVDIVDTSFVEVDAATGIAGATGSFSDLTSPHLARTHELELL